MCSSFCCFYIMLHCVGHFRYVWKSRSLFWYVISTEVAANKVNVRVETAENISFDNEWILKINGREFNTNYIFKKYIF